MRSRALLVCLVIVLMLAFVGASIVYLAFGWYPSINSEGHGSLGWGLLHGFMLPWNLVISLFKDGAILYQFPNDGILYNCGFFLGVVMFVGGAGSVNSRSRQS